MDPKQAIEWKKCIKSSKKHHPAHTKHNSTIKKNYSGKLPFEQAYNPPPPPTPPHISTLDSTHLFVVRLLFQKVACNFWKVANFCNHVNLPWLAYIYTEMCLLLTISDLAVFAADCAVSRTMTTVYLWFSDYIYVYVPNWCRRILKLSFILRYEMKSNPSIN